MKRLVELITRLVTRKKVVVTGQIKRLSIEEYPVLDFEGRIGKEEVEFLLVNRQKRWFVIPIRGSSLESRSYHENEVNGVAKYSGIDGLYMEIIRRVSMNAKIKNIVTDLRKRIG